MVLDFLTFIILSLFFIIFIPYCTAISCKKLHLELLVLHKKKTEIQAEIDALLEFKNFLAKFNSEIHPTNSENQFMAVLNNINVPDIFYIILLLSISVSSVLLAYSFFSNTAAPHAITHNMLTAIAKQNVDLNSELSTVILKNSSDNTTALVEFIDKTLFILNENMSVINMKVTACESTLNNIAFSASPAVKVMVSSLNCIKGMS